MDNDFKGISPSLINDAIFNVAIRHEVVRQQLFDNKYYCDAYTSFPCISYIKSMRNLATSIEFGSGHATWGEYYKLLCLFIQGLAQTKKISIEAAQEIVATEVKAVQTLHNINQNRVIAKQEQSEKIWQAILYFSPSIVGFIIFAMIFTYVAQTVNARLLNQQELEALKTENQQLIEETHHLKKELDKFNQFQQERNNLEKLKSENLVLKQKNSNLNDRLIQCKKPFWERKCD